MDGLGLVQRKRDYQMSLLQRYFDTIWALFKNKLLLLLTTKDRRHDVTDRPPLAADASAKWPQHGRGIWRRTGGRHHSPPQRCCNGPPRRSQPRPLSSLVEPMPKRLGASAYDVDTARHFLTRSWRWKSI